MGSNDLDESEQLLASRSLGQILDLTTTDLELSRSLKDSFQSCSLFDFDDFDSSPGIQMGLVPSWKRRIYRYLLSSLLGAFTKSHGQKE